MSLKSKADELLRRATEAGDVPGVTACATTRDTTIYEGGFGKRVLGQSATMTPDTIVWIASMTKAITGMAAMQMVERGKLELDAPAANVVPQIGKAQVLEGFDAAGKPRLRAPKRPITLRHLLTHTAGFSYDFWSAEMKRYLEVTGTPGIISCKNAALDIPLLFDPGDRWEYGTNIDWAGKMVEVVSGQTLGAYLRDHVLGPLGMNDTAFKITPGMRQRLAKIHQRDQSGTLAPIDLEIPQEPEFEMGGGGLYGTVGDYLKFVRLMLNQGRANGKQLLKPETVAEMSRNNIGGIRLGLLKTVMPDTTLDAEFFPGQPKTWGLSFMINETEAPTGRSAGSLAWCGLINAFSWIDQKKGVGGVYATQILPFFDTKSLPLYLAFETEVYRSLQ